LAFILIFILHISHALGTTEKHELIFIDAHVEDYNLLASGLPNTANVVVLDSAKNGLEQIAEHLKGHRSVDTIHLISHGNEGKIQLGNFWLSKDTIATNGTHLEFIGEALGAYGHLLLYGCGVAENESGREFVNSLANLTGTNVAASNNLTGNSQYGGDW